MDISSLKGAFTLSYIGDNGEIIQQTVPNTITTVGKQMLLDYLSGSSSLFVNYIGLGLDSTGAAVGNTDLNHEIYRARTESVTTDVANNKITWHMSIVPSSSLGVIEELGVYDRVKNTDASLFEDILISNFDETTWSSNGTLVANSTAQFKEGIDSLKTTTTGTSTTNTLSKALDLSLMSSTDEFSWWIYPVATTNLTTITLRFKTDGSNYYYYAFSTWSAAAWNRKSATKTSFSTTGSPSWENITQIETVIAQSGASAIDIHFDSLRAIRKNSNSRLFSRAVVSPALTKANNKEVLVTYSLTFS